MGGAGSSGAALSEECNAEPGTFPGRLFKRSETIQRQGFFRGLGVSSLSDSSIVLRENSPHSCVKQA